MTFKIEQRSLNPAGRTGQQQARLQPAQFSLAAEQFSHRSPSSGSVSSTWILAAQAPSPCHRSTIPRRLQFPISIVPMKWTAARLVFIIRGSGAGADFSRGLISGSHKGPTQAEAKTRRGGGGVLRGSGANDHPLLTEADTGPEAVCCHGTAVL